MLAIFDHSLTESNHFVKTHAKHDLGGPGYFSIQYAKHYQIYYVYILYKFGCYAEHNTKFMQAGEAWPSED